VSNEGRESCAARSIEVRIVIQDEGEEVLGQDRDLCGYSMAVDHVLEVSREDVDSEGVDFLQRAFCQPAEYKSLEITCPVNGAVDLSPILDALSQERLEKARIALHRCYVPALMLDRLISSFYGVLLIGCVLGPGWDGKKRDDSNCESLQLVACVAAPRSGDALGRAAWPKLTSLSVDQNRFCRRLIPKAIEQAPIVLHENSFEANPSDLMQAFLARTIGELEISDWRESPRLDQLPVLRDLTHLNISGTETTQEDLDWITRQSAVEAVSLSWFPETELQWESLAKLSGLEFLGVTSTTFCDDELERVLECTELVSLWTYYSQVTSASWGRILRNSSLKSVWLSSETLEGEPPKDPPAETGLKEVVAMNVGPSNMVFLRKLMEPYPDVNVVEM
jgi:hypothetical protein